MRFDIARRLLDKPQAQLVTFAVVVGPVDKAVLAHHQPLQRRIVADCPLHHQSQVETGALPRDPADLVAVNLAGKRLAVLGRGDRDHRVRVGVVDVFVGDKSV